MDPGSVGDRPPLELPGRTGRGPRSLTAKITVGVVSLVVVLVAIVGTTTFYALRSFLFDRLDQQLTSIVNSNTARIAQCFRNGEQSCSLGGGSLSYQAPQVEWVAVLTGNGQQRVSVLESPSLRAITLTQNEIEQISAQPQVPRTIVTATGQRLRISAESLHTPFGHYTVVSGLSTEEVSRILRRLVLLEVVIGGASVVLAMLATTAGVRLSLRRLRRVTLTAQDVATELSPEGAGLERRVPDDEPDTEVGQLATSFNTMLAAVETQFAARVESERRMRQFLADASHELRTPLTSIRGYAELARMQRAAGDDSEDNLDRIEFEGTRMSRLVEDLLMLARGDGNAADRPPRHELIELEALLDDAVSGARAAFADREILVDPVPPHLHVVGDPDQLLRVVRNLINNAAVHTAPERPIRVRGGEDGPDVVIQVIDGGPGLPPEEAAHVFERFWRADKARTRARGGSGLGLAIVAAVVNAHGGTVRFDSTVEHGSTVTVRLPGIDGG